MAEIMILIIFLLLMALTAALAQRDRQIKQLSGGSETQQLMRELQERFPNAKTPDDFFKELTLAADAKQRMERLADEQDLSEQLVEDAAVGAAARKLAQEDGIDDPLEVIREKSDKRSKWPPFISLSEEDGFFFRSGSAQLQPNFERALRTTTAARLSEIVRAYGVNVIEVIGHTDDVPMPGSSNLDVSLIPAVQGKLSTAELRPADNPGLAMARATSVARVLRSDPRFGGVTILPLSGAQMIEPVDRLATGKAAGDVKERRRIEIRVRRSTQELNPQSASMTSR
jgi:flagellar motor protein MotB